MTHFVQRSIILIAGLSGILESAYGQICVTSDDIHNTACGTNALMLDSAIEGTDNSAFGYQALRDNTSGQTNTAVGSQALAFNTTGVFNTAVGFRALGSTTGSNNTATGVSALSDNMTGNNNTATGYGALYFSNGNNNTANGYLALQYNTTGNNNTAVGYEALGLGGYITGSNNTATGYLALAGNSVGSNNTAYGADALYSNATGENNNAIGYEALHSNTTGKGNAAQGANALYNNTTGIRNLGIGNNALYDNVSGNYNLALGFDAGYNVTTGSNNIDIANPGESTDGMAANSGVIRIGTQSPTAFQSNTYIAGIYDNTSVSGLPIVIDSNGQLGTVSSSERFKTDIQPMGLSTERLQQLRPVAFHYKADAQRTLRYGLIAEEVAKVYPELVVRDRHGRIDGVRYDKLTPMLLNQAQKQQEKIAALAAANSSQAAEIRDLKKLVLEMQAGLLKLQAKDELVAQR